MYKFKKTLAQTVETPPMFHMLRIYICDHGNSCRQAIEGAVTFISLNNHPFALSSAGIGLKGMDYATINHSWVKATSVQ